MPHVAGSTAKAKQSIAHHCCANQRDGLLAELGVEKSLSRPYNFEDNPCSEAKFKTMKYRPTYPSRFGSLEDAKA